MELAEVDRKSDGKTAATGKGSSAGATARRRSRGRVLGKRRDTRSKPQSDEEEEADLEEEEKQEPKPASVQRVWTSADFEKSEGFLKFIGKTAEEYAASKAAFASRPRRIETAEEWEARVRKNIEEQNKAYEEMMRSQDEDESNWDYIAYRNSWYDSLSGIRWSFEDASEFFFCFSIQMHIYAYHELFSLHVQRLAAYAYALSSNYYKINRDEKNHNFKIRIKY